MTDISATTATSEDFNAALRREEALANFAAMNKIREALLVAMTRDLEKGGDGKRFLDALAAIRDEVQFSKITLDDILEKSSK